VIDDMVRGREDNLRTAQALGRVRLIQGDIGDRALLASTLEGADTVFHLAALRITQCAAEPRRAIEVMVNATFDLLDLCVEHKVGKVVMASSASIYGEATEFPTTESHHPYGNRTLYGAAKSFGEGLLRSFNDMYGLDYVALRYFNVYGPRMDIHGRYTEVLIRWMERLEGGLPPIIFGDGLQTMDFVHVQDVARANILAATSPATDVVLNVGNGIETSLLDLARALARAMGRSALEPLHEPARSINPVNRRLASIEAAERLIGFTPSTSLDSGLRDLVEWWRAARSSAPSSFGGRAA
jgi:UDP-glucose 4-epimerase